MYQAADQIAKAAKLAEEEKLAAARARFDQSIRIISGSSYEALMPRPLCLKYAFTMPRPACQGMPIHMRRQEWA